jgi:hypothetical protein
MKSYSIAAALLFFILPSYGQETAFNKSGTPPFSQKFTQQELMVSRHWEIEESLLPTLWVMEMFS